MTILTVKAAFEAAQACGLARIDAQLLMLHALNKPDTDRAWLVAHDQDLLDGKALDDFRAFSLRRVAGEPLAYITGFKEFFGLRFAIDKRVLVPRPDTETLVQWALDVLQGISSAQVLDLGTGSGAVAIAIAHRLDCTVTATDISSGALTVASDNALRLATNIQCVQSSWFANVHTRFHLVVSNPPYIADADPHLDALLHEPINALTAGNDGLRDIRHIVQQAPEHLKPGGWLLLEHGYNQAAAVRELLANRGFSQVKTRLDLPGIERCSGGQWAN